MILCVSISGAGTPVKNRRPGPSVAVAGLYHESNTFVRERTGRAEFDRGGIQRGDAVGDAWGETASALGGFLRSGSLGLEITPIFSAWASPSGLIEHDLFVELTDELCDRLAGRRWDGVLLALHGAAAAQGFDNADQYITQRVREAVGSDAAIGICLDPHANISAESVRAADVTLLYRTNPHVDAAERAHACADLVRRCIAGEIAPVQAVVKPPVVINILRQNTNVDPLKAICEAVAAAEDDRVLSTSLAIGYPYADVHDMGPAIVAIADEDAALAEAAAVRLSRLMWDARDDLQGDALSPAAAAEAAAADRHGTVLLLDTGDNIGAGSPGDSTTLLHAVSDAGARPWLATIVDGQAVRACQAAGEGGAVELAVGGKTAAHDRPFRVDGRVRALSSGRFEDRGVTHGGFAEFDMGPTAAVETADGNAIVITTYAVIDSSAERYRSVGIEPTDYRVVIARGVQSPLPSYGPLASLVIQVMTPGVTTADIASLGYTRRRSPLYPLDPLGK
jgi:microcystin degradation protein MlrC